MVILRLSNPTRLGLVRHAIQLNTFRHKHPFPVTSNVFRPPSLQSRLSHHLASKAPWSSRRPPLLFLLLSVSATAGAALWATPSSQPAVQLDVSPPFAAQATQQYPQDRPSILRRWLDLVDCIIIEPLATAKRFLYLLALFLPLLVTSPILLLEFVELGHPARNRRRSMSINERRSTKLWYQALVHAMQLAGPTFIKLAQWAGTRTDLFPSSLCQSFGRLHSNGKPHSMSHTRKVLEEAFGIPFQDIFVAFDEVPLGIGAVAQVYRATLKPDLLPLSYLGPKHTIDKKRSLSFPLSLSEVPDKKPTHSVAIKILHPKVAKTIARDLRLMKFFANLINLFPGAEWLSLPEEVSVFGTLMKSQINLKQESNNLETFEKFFKNRMFVSFPRPLTDYCSEEVLVEEFVDGLGLKEFLKRDHDVQGPFDHRIAEIGLDAFLHMLLIDNFVHADLHPGNIMIKFYKPKTPNFLRTLWRQLVNSPESSEPIPTAEEESHSQTIINSLRSLSKKNNWKAWNEELIKLDQQGYQPELIFIDSGLITSLNDLNRQNFLELFEAIAHFDGYKAGKLMVERCRTPDLVIDEETFSLKIQHLALSVKSKTFSLSSIKVSDVLISVLNSVREHHVKLEADFINTILSILLLEGIGRQLNPDLDLFKSAIPILRSLGSIENLKEKDGVMMSAKKLGSLFKIWFWLEARQMAGIAVREIDSMIRYDLLSFFFANPLPLFAPVSLNFICNGN